MRRRNDEELLHMAVVRYLHVAFPGLLFLHPANGGSRHKAEAGKLKAMGVMAGAPDLLFWWNSYSGNKAWIGNCVRDFVKAGAIELKSEKGRLTDTQTAFKDAFEKNGGRWALCRSIDEVRDTLISWGIPCRESR